MAGTGEDMGWGREGKEREGRASAPKVQCLAPPMVTESKTCWFLIFDFHICRDLGNAGHRVNDVYYVVI